MEKIENLDKPILIREEVRQILYTPPTGILRWGIYVIFVLFIGCISLIGFINYPKIIAVKTILIIEKPLLRHNILKAQFKLSAKNLEQIKQGQKVKVKFDRYPFSEYGIISGIITKIYYFKNDKDFTIIIELTDGLQTSFKKVLPYEEYMPATADIIVTDISVLTRLILKLQNESV